MLCFYLFFNRRGYENIEKIYGTEPDIPRAFDCVNFSVDEGEEQAKKNDEQLTIEDGRIVE